MKEEETQKTIDPHTVAKLCEAQIKAKITERFFVADDELVLLLEDQDGVYLSQQEPNTLCCLVVGKENGFLYLVTAEITAGGTQLTNLKSDIVS